MQPDQLLQQNRQWAAQTHADQPELFARLAHQQNPDYLWLGCADSRVPANQVLGLQPGQMFVHRNIANQVQHNDLNCMAVLHYAVDVLKVKHVIVCGHYGCGGVKAAMGTGDAGLVDYWLRGVKQHCVSQHQELSRCGDEQARFDRMCELNVAQQVSQVCQTKALQGAWQRGQQISVHGWIYRLQDGLIKDLELSVSGADQVDALFRAEG